MTSAVRADQQPPAATSIGAAARARIAAQRAGGTASPAAFGGYVDGANALTIGYADPPGLASPAVGAPPAGAPRRRAGGASAPRRREPAAVPVAPALPREVPLPVALPRGRFLLTMACVVVVGVVGVLVLNTKINEDSFRLDRLRSEQDGLDLREQQLTQELAERESTGNLRAAAARLGLVPAGEPAFIRLPDGRVVGVPQPARATSGR